MKKIFYLLTIIILMSCSSTKPKHQKRCKSPVENSFSAIVYDKFIFVINQDTIVVNEVKYDCVITAFYTQKVIYDKFGKWNKAVYPNKEMHSILIWENIKLFPEDTTTFIIAATGKEAREGTYTSILVFDENNNDLLKENSPYRNKLTDYFGKLITENDSEKNDFYEAYWTTFDPEYWKKLQYYKTLRTNNSKN